MSENIDLGFAKRLKIARIVQSYSIEDAAKATGFSTKTYERYEAGHNKHLRRDSILKLANGLRCSPVYLVGLIEDNDLDL